MVGFRKYTSMMVQIDFVFDRLVRAHSICRRWDQHHLAKCATTV